MRICPTCTERYDDAARFCPRDGSPLPIDEADGRIGSTLLGQFELLEVCGKGAMGTVYRAWQGGMERQVAIKILRSELLPDPKTVARFEREARAVAKLQHPNIVTCFLVGRTDDGLPFLAMEYVEGESLAAVAEREQSLPEARVLHIGRQITAALTEAHAEGIVHRDLKPANILLTDRRRMPDFVKILDFGIAKILGGEVDLRSDLESRLTKAGAIFGTPHYISPEQAAGSDVDHRADLYSLGCVLYRLATGRLPFEGSGIEVLLAHMGQPAPPPEGIDPLLGGIIMRCLEKDPAARFQSADELADALDAAGAELHAGSRPSKSVDRAPLPASEDIPITVDRPPSDPSVAAGESQLPVDPPKRRRGAFWATVIGTVLVTGSAAGAVWLFQRDDETAVVTPGAASADAGAVVTLPPPATTDAGQTTTAETPAPDMRTVTLGEEGYAIRAQVPRDPRIGVAYTLVFDVIHPSGKPLEDKVIGASFEDPDDQEDDVELASTGVGRYQITRTFAAAGRHHVHVFPETSKKLHIWFDLLVKDENGKLPEPKVVVHPPVKARKPTPAVQMPVVPEPTPKPPVIEKPELVAPGPPPPPLEEQPQEGAGASDPYHDGVVEDDPIKEPEVTPPKPQPQRRLRRWRRPAPQQNPDGLE